MTRKFLIDTDTASDDAVALLMAFCSPDVEVVGITTVAGNVPVGRAAQNALYTAELCGVDVPVFKGASRPLLRKYQHAEWFHGKDGMGNQNYPMPQRQPESKHAVDALIGIVKANPGIVLVTLGPLTNIALAISRAPEIVMNISRCVVMGGAAATHGNVTPAAEYNIWVDPEAARIVFLSGLPIEMIGWEFSKGDFVLSEAEIQYVRSLDTPYAHFAIDSNAIAKQAYFTQTGEVGIALPDPVAMAVALDPSICTKNSKHYVGVEVSSDLTRGMTVVDKLNLAEDERNLAVWDEHIIRGNKISVAWELDARRWKALLYALLQ